MPPAEPPGSPWPPPCSQGPPIPRRAPTSSRSRPASATARLKRPAPLRSSPGARCPARPATSSRCSGSTATGAPGGGSQAGVATGIAAIRGENPDSSGNAFGVLGLSHSPAGAGLVARNELGLRRRRQPGHALLSRRADRETRNRRLGLCPGRHRLRRHLDVLQRGPGRSCLQRRGQPRRHRQSPDAARRQFPARRRRPDRGAQRHSTADSRVFPHHGGQRAPGTIPARPLRSAAGRAAAAQPLWRRRLDRKGREPDPRSPRGPGCATSPARRFSSPAEPIPRMSS